MQVPVVLTAERAVEMSSALAANARKATESFLNFSDILAQSQNGIGRDSISKTSSSFGTAEQSARETQAETAAETGADDDKSVTDSSTSTERTQADKTAQTASETDDNTTQTDSSVRDTSGEDPADDTDDTGDVEDSSAYAASAAAGSSTTASASTQESASTTVSSLESLSTDISAGIRAQLMRTLLELMKSSLAGTELSTDLDAQSVSLESLAEMLGVASDSKVSAFDDLMKMLVSQNQQLLSTSLSKTPSMWFANTSDLLAALETAQQGTTGSPATLAELMKALGGSADDAADTLLQSLARNVETVQISTSVPGTAKAQTQGATTPDAVLPVGASVPLSAESLNTQGNSVKTEATAGTQSVDLARMTDLLRESAIRSIRYLAAQGEKSMTVKLVPESLGELHLEVTSGQDGVNVRLMSANSGVRSLLNADLPNLRDALLQDGLQVLNVSVTADTSSYTTAHQQSGSGRESTLSAFNDVSAVLAGDASAASETVSSLLTSSRDGTLNLLV